MRGDLPQPTLGEAALREAAERLIGGTGGLAGLGGLRLLPAERSGQGDLSTAAAWPLARLSARPAGVLAAELAGALARLPAVAATAVAGPAMVNLRLRDGCLEALAAELAAGEAAPAGVAMVFGFDRLRLEDPGFLVQHVHARCRALIRDAGAVPAPADWRPALAGAARRPPARAVMLQLDHALRALALAPALPGAAGRCPLRERVLRLAQASLGLWKAPADDATVPRGGSAADSGLEPLPSATVALARGTARIIRAALERLGEDAAEEIR